MANIKKNDKAKGKKTAGELVETACIGEKKQTRFKRIPNKHLSKETIAEFRDMNLGRVKNGKPSGAPNIRIDTGKNTNVKPHINVNPKGFLHPKNPHIEVTAKCVNNEGIIIKTLEYAEATLTVAAVVMDTWRIASALKDDIYVQNHADEIIKELEVSIRKLENKLKVEHSSLRRADIKITIDRLKLVLRDVNRTKMVPVKTIKTLSSIGGSWSAGAAGGYAGALGGAGAGASIGTLFGPVGSVIGAPVGAVVGGITGGWFSRKLGSAAGTALAEEGLKIAD